MKARLITVSLVFLALTIVRVSFPETVAIAREKLQPVAQYGEDLAGSILAIGKKLSGNEEAEYAWEKSAIPEEPDEFTPAMAPEGFDLDEMISSNLMGFGGGTEGGFFPPETEDHMDSELDPAPDPALDPEAEATASVTSALQTQIDEFLVQQTAVTDLALPDTICTDVVLLNFDFVSPSNIEYTSAFGYRLHPIYNDIRFHYGTDFQAYTGDPISAFADGTVIAAQTFDGYGLTIIIDHGNGFTSLYAHCSVLNVSFGDTVTMGQTIALVGATGNVTGPHLHFELQKDGKYLNPEFYL